MTVEVSAVVWTVFAVVGAALSAANAYDAWLDLRALRGAVNGRRVVARANLRSQALRAVKMVVWIIPGSVVAFNVVPPSQRRGELVIWFLVVGIVLATVNSTMDRVAKRRLLAGYARRHPANGNDDGDGGGGSV